MRLPFVRLERASPRAQMRQPPLLVDLVLAEPASRPAARLEDLVAPAAIQIGVDHLVLDGELARVLVLVGLPPTAEVGWLEPLVAASLPVELALFIASEDVSATASQLAHRHIRLQSSLGHDAAEGRPPDPALVAAEEQTAHLRHALARGAERPFRAALYVLLRAHSKAELDQLTRRAQDAVSALGGRLVVARLQQEAGIQACLPEGQDALGLDHPLETSSLVTAYPFPPSS